MGQTQSEGWDGLGVDPGNVSSRGVGSLSPLLLRNAPQQHSPAQHSLPVALGDVPECSGCLGWYRVPQSGRLLNTMLGSHIPVIPANTNISLVPTLLHQVSIYCQWP